MSTNQEAENRGRIPAVVNIEDVKIKQSIKDIVFGYIRNTYCDYIPGLIIYWCLLYYYEKEEFFSKCNDTISIINDCTAKGLQNTGQSSYIFGHKIIKKLDNCTYIWCFKMFGDFPDPTMFWGSPLEIGITDKMDINDKPNSHYFYCSSGLKNSIKSDSYFDYPWNQKCEQYGTPFGVNDNKMKLNVVKRTLRFYVNDKAQGIAFNAIVFGKNQKYKMVLSINSGDIPVQLIDFTQNMIECIFSSPLPLLPHQF